jgi:hypothetical protein
MASVTTRVYLVQYLFFKINGRGKGQNNFNVGGISEVSLHPTSSVWGKG